jgi:Cu(I)/Ag(I) efflux system membrane protein CusA/SilA
MDAKLVSTRGCRTSGGCRSRRAPRCSRPASGARSASRCSATTLVEIEEAAIAIEKALSGRPRDAERVRRPQTGGFYLDVDVKREAAARHGLSVGDVNDVVETAIGGMPSRRSSRAASATRINLRYPRELRDDPDALGDILVATPTGAQVPLSQVAGPIKFVTGPPMIRSEGRPAGRLRLRRHRDRPIADYVADAKHRRRTRGRPARGYPRRVGRPVPAPRARPRQA